MPLNNTELERDIYIMNTVELTANTSNWKRVMVQGEFPRLREGASVTVDQDGGVVYLVGGRVVEE